MFIASSKRIGQKQAWIETWEEENREPVKVLKSYSTRVAFASGAEGYISTSYYYGGKSQTTGRHISVFCREYPGVTWRELEHGDFTCKLWGAID